MQTLYSITSFEKKELQNRTYLARLLDEKLNQVFDVFTACVLYPFYIAEYAETDASKRSNKYLQTEDDRHVDIRLASNPYVVASLGNKSLQEKIKRDKVDRFVDNTLVKKLYQQLTKSEIYATYISNNQPTAVESKAIIQAIWEQIMLKDDDLMTTFTDEMPGWEDNSELIGMLMENYYKNNSRIDFINLLSAEKKEYAHELLLSVLDREEYCMELIAPKLTNWDKERVAMIDMLLLRMAVCEFLYFPTIPTKVTINEYIDIAKQYSLPQSGQFVNGVLDNLLKDLEKESLIRKQERIRKK